VAQGLTTTLPSFHDHERSGQQELTGSFMIMKAAEPDPVRVAG